MFELFVELRKKLFSKEEKRGRVLLLSLALAPLFFLSTLVLLFLTVSSSLPRHPLWSFGLLASLILGLFLSLLSFLEGREAVSQLEELEHEKTKQKSLFDAQQKEMQKREEQEREETKRKLATLQLQCEEAQKRARLFEELSTVKRYDWEQIEEEKEALFQEKAVALQEISALKEELFAQEGKGLSLQKKLDEKLLESKKEVEELLFQRREDESHVQSLEQAMKCQEELIAQLSAAKPPRKRKPGTSKSKVAEALEKQQLSLEILS
ncbi:MAG: hypothetical protein A3G30_03230 [Chlamydiae bacterium RIFCSPLOWO2_12_FULL_49_12]|nr:MAG: hypothetical protein A3D18_01310 [Chlamydiae bacterium RIFCSPHIGHO2_02_FULL_49_29]OGN63065.1 MAG: hypothetical protein A3E26_05480 [Chlamydiae bacterium RIFCSPHIGHO2_12_FULL_49_32]OGN74769.1 MAG: hypothetical protein A3G30_03230 [Chlamydiae bacterium RIFCSPLOWO2_12_FULL_49_12]